jgi:hypothetical protein
MCCIQVRWFFDLFATHKYGRTHTHTYKPIYARTQLYVLYIHISIFLFRSLFPLDKPFFKQSLSIHYILFVSLFLFHRFWLCKITACLYKCIKHAPCAIEISTRANIIHTIKCKQYALGNKRETRK